MQTLRHETPPIPTDDVAHAHHRKLHRFSASVFKFKFYKFENSIFKKILFETFFAKREKIFLL